MSAITVFEARHILTMNPSQPRATHVAVRDGRILAVGSAQDVSGWGPSTLNRRFAQQFLMPGLVEGHSHLMAGTLWRYVYCGYFDATDPNGRIWPGLKTLDAVVAALSDAAQNGAGSAAPIVGWGFDPIYFGQRRCSRADLDRVSDARPVGVLHASGHILNVNTAALKAGGFFRTGIDHPAFPLGADGLPTGELKGPEAMMPMLDHVGLSRSFLSGDETGIRDFARLCVRAGVTTATDLAATLGDAEVATLQRLTSEDTYPVRIVPLLRMIGMKPADVISRAVTLKAQSSERLRLGHVKVVADGSIQGFSARLRWPGYFNGQPNGLWYTAPEAMREAFTLGLLHEVLIHTHTNGDEATELVLDCMQQALASQPRADHRYTLQHCQLADDAQYRRMKTLGMCVNLFANHHFYWGDQHHDVTVGPDRARRMNACRSALDAGVPMAIHSDAPITPMGPLFTAWCAVHRLTASGRVLGEAQRITVAEALRAVTLGAAYTLRLDGEIGSIECGKRADFCVLNADPTTQPSSALKDMRPWGTVQGGRVFQA